MKLFFRNKFVFKEEIEIASKYFEIVNTRSALTLDKPHPHHLPVLCKYSTTSNNYREYCEDLKNFGLFPINDINNFNWSSRISCWYYHLEQFTPRTWFNPFENPFMRQSLENFGGPYFVRYDTKSKRELWKTHAYARDFKSLVEIGIRLSEDYKFENEIVAVREYIDFQGYNMRQVSGAPVLKEFRIHRLLGREICRHFYWEPYQEEIESIHGKIDLTEIPEEWLNKITNIADEWSNFYVLDIAQRTDGTWMLIEVNEGQHAGVHTDLLDTYYKRLREIIHESYGNSEHVQSHLQSLQGRTREVDSAREASNEE